MRYFHTVVAHPIYGDGESGEAIAEASASNLAACLDQLVDPIGAYLVAHRDELEESGEPYLERIELSLTWEERDA